MGFRIKQENSKILRSIIETLASIIDETELRVNTEGFKIAAMDPSRICLLEIWISKDHFDEYYATNEDDVGINLDDLNKVMKRAGANDSIELLYENKDQKIQIKMRKPDQKRTRTFSLSILDLEIEEIPMENLLQIEYRDTFSIEPNLIIEALKDAEIYSEIFNIQASPDTGSLMFSSGNDSKIGEMEYELDLEELEDGLITEKEFGSYSVAFLKKIFKLAPIVEKVSFGLKTEQPLRLDFDFQEGGQLHYFLAPRVEGDDIDDDYDEDDIEPYDDREEP